MKHVTKKDRRVYTYKHKTERLNVEEILNMIFIISFCRINTNG